MTSRKFSWRTYCIISLLNTQSSLILPSKHPGWHPQCFQRTYKEMQRDAQSLFKREHAWCQALYQVLEKNVIKTSQSPGRDMVNTCNNTFTSRLWNVKHFESIRTGHLAHHVRRVLQLASLSEETNNSHQQKFQLAAQRGRRSHPSKPSHERRLRWSQPNSPFTETRSHPKRGYFQNQNCLSKIILDQQAYEGQTIEI